MPPPRARQGREPRAAWSSWSQPQPALAGARHRHGRRPHGSGLRPACRPRHRQRPHRGDAARGGQARRRQGLRQHGDGARRRRGAALRGRRASISSPAASPRIISPTCRPSCAEVLARAEGRRHLCAGRQHLARCGVDAGLCHRRAARGGPRLQRLREAPRPEPRPLPRHGRMDRDAERHRPRGRCTRSGCPRTWSSSRGPSAWAAMRATIERLRAMLAEGVAGAEGIPQAAPARTASSGSRSTRPSSSPANPCDAGPTAWGPRSFTRAPRLQAKP